MNREDILQMGRRAGSFIELAQEKDLLWLERFAALVASDAQEKEREAIAKWLDDEKDATYWAELVRARGQA